MQQKSVTFFSGKDVELVDNKTAAYVIQDTLPEVNEIKNMLMTLNLWKLLKKIWQIL